MIVLEARPHLFSYLVTSVLVFWVCTPAVCSNFGMLSFKYQAVQILTQQTVALCIMIFLYGQVGQKWVVYEKESESFYY